MTVAQYPTLCGCRQVPERGGRAGESVTTAHLAVPLAGKALVGP